MHLFHSWHCLFWWSLKAKYLYGVSVCSLESLLQAYTGWPGTVDTVDFSGLCSDQQLSSFTLLDRASSPHYITNTKIIKFGWELFILWVISYGLSFSGFVITRAFHGTVDTVDFQDFALINSYLFSPCWIEHPFLIIRTPRSSNLVENFLFYE